MELEVVRSASLDRDSSIDAELKANLKAQAKAISAEDTALFHDLDYRFHELLCASAKQTSAFAVISANKAQVDRLCMLSLTSKETMDCLYEDHELLLDALFSGDGKKAVEVLRLHLDRLTPTIDAIFATHRSYFDE